MKVEVRDIVSQYLISHGYDGLYSLSGECACLTNDLAPCCEESMGCQPGIKGPCDPENCPADGDCEWHINPGEPHSPISSPIARDAAIKMCVENENLQVRTPFSIDFNCPNCGKKIDTIPPSTKLMLTAEQIQSIIQSAIDADRRSDSSRLPNLQKALEDMKGEQIYDMDKFIIDLSESIFTSVEGSRDQFEQDLAKGVRDALRNQIPKEPRDDQ